MTNQIRNYCCLLIFLLISTLSFAQKQFHITIQFMPKLDTLDTKGIRIVLDEGKGFHRIPIVIKNGKIDINCNVYSKYAYLNISSSLTSNQEAYLITKEESSIVYYGNNKSVKGYPFVNSKLVNVVDIDDCKELKEIIAYTKKEITDLDDFREKHQADLKKNDSLKSIYREKGKTLERKSLEFIKLKSNQYYYFWYFNFSFKDSQYFSTDSLLQFYEDALYSKYKNLFEAKYTLDFLKARTLRINQPAPDFTTIDITGKKVSLKQLRGKYVYINIWATWCAPCMAELPELKKLRDDYPKDQLEMIGVSEDDTQAILEKGIKQYSLNWTHVFKDNTLINKYAFTGAVPLSFLIDREGRLIFKQVGGFSDTDELRKLMMKNESHHE